MRIEKDGQIIRTLAEWRRHAPPKSAKHWVEGRSAFEMARAWCIDEVPIAVRQLLDSHQRTRGMLIDTVTPEHRIFFDAYGGEPRNADLAFVGRASNDTVAVTVEGKADEPFGDTVAKTIAAALERAIKNPRSRGVRRVEDLVKALLSARTRGLPHVAGLRYQLLTAVAGSLAFARERHASIAVLIVQEFVTERTRNDWHERNCQDYQAFLYRLSGIAPVKREARLLGKSKVEKSATLEGPFQVPATTLFPTPVPLFIGKITKYLRITS